MSKLYRILSLIMLAVALLACGGAYADAIAKGDKFADAAQWDEAAAAYEEAIKIDPEDPEAKIKLKEVRRKQAAERLQRAIAMEKRGEVAQALVLVQEAAKFDPANVDAQKALTRITEAVLDKANKLYKKEKLRQAFELTTLVLKGAKNHPRARELDDKVRSALAEKSFTKAKAYIEKERFGNALVELAACITYRPDYPDAKLHFGQVKLKLEDQLRFTVVLDRFAGQGKAASMQKALNAEMLQQSIDERLLLKVVGKAPAKDDDHSGVLLTGEFVDYAFNHNKQEIKQTCRWECRHKMEHNPEIDRLRIEADNARKPLQGVDQEIARKEKDVASAEKRLMDEEREAQDKQGKVDQARQRVDQCRAKAPPDKSNPCSSEESSLRSKQGDLDRARRDVDSARSNVQRKRDDVQRVKDRRQSAQDTIKRAETQLANTPLKIRVPVYCNHEYNVDRHVVAAKVTLKLSIDELGEGKSVLSGQPFNYDTKAKDDAFVAQQGVCPEVATANPLQIPSEKEMRKTLSKKVIIDVRKKVLASYDAYRRGFLTAARRHEAAGVTDKATEAYVRYVLTGPHKLEDKKKLGEFFSKNNGVGKLDALWSL